MRWIEYKLNLLVQFILMKFACKNIEIILRLYILIQKTVFQPYFSVYRIQLGLIFDIIWEDILANTKHTTLRLL